MIEKEKLDIIPRKKNRITRQVFGVGGSWSPDRSLKLFCLCVLQALDFAFVLSSLLDALHPQVGHMKGAPAPELGRTLDSKLDPAPFANNYLQPNSTQQSKLRRSSPEPANLQLSTTWPTSCAGAPARAKMVPVQRGTHGDQCSY